MKWALVLLVAGLVVVAVAVALWWPDQADLGERAEATVTAPASCGSGDAYDRVEITIDGQVRTARLDGCGHARDEKVEVVLPADTADTTGAAGDLLVQAASSAPVGLPLENRLTALLLCLSGLAGGLYAHLLTRRPQPTSAAGAA